MGMPEIPSGKNRPKTQEVIVDLLESIALEEMAMAHIMNAEGEKLQEVVKKYSCCHISFSDLNQNCRDSKEVINSLIMKEWLLVTKMATILQIKENNELFPRSCNNKNP